MIPISKDILQPAPIPKSNILFVNSIEEFEKIELDLCQTVIAFDTSKEKQVFYAKERDKYGEYSPVMIFFYQNFAQKIQDFEKEQFEKKCREAGLDPVKTQMAYMFFVENKKPQEVWIWLLDNKIKDYSWDYVYNVKSTLKKKLFPKVV